MEKKKINFVTLVLVVLVVLGIGIAVGYLITKNIDETNTVKEVSSEEVKSQTEKTVENEIIETAESNTNHVTAETPKYDGSKNITVDGKTYTIAYVNEPDGEYSDYYKVTLYFNNTKLKTYKNIGNIDESWNNEPEVELASIIGKNEDAENEEYIIITLNSYQEAPRLNKQFCIINTKGDIIGTFYDDGGEQIIIKDGKERTSDATRLEDVEINEDHIILYDVIYQNHVENQNGTTEFKNFGIKYKITIEKNEFKKEAMYIYTEDDAEFAGK